MDAEKTDLGTSIGLLVLRLGFGGYMAAHGWGKVQMVLAGAFDKFGDPIGLGNKLSLILAAGAEFGCALLVLVGLLTRLAAVPVAFTMGVAAFLVHTNDPWMMHAAGASKEPALLFLSAFLALAFTGAGRFSLDAVLGPRWRARKGQG
ncbi:MAG: DoxX family protein [Planctomycetes bacterium]|nr:DoxX family protein [Planctomycetota bacterium]